jgi:thiol-disulfide isomerase/thioredoxin
MRTRVASRSGSGLGVAVGAGPEPSGGRVISGDAVADGATLGATVGGGSVGLMASTGNVYESRPAASSVTPDAVSSAGRIRVRNPSMGPRMGRSCYPRVRRHASGPSYWYPPRDMRAALSIVAGLLAGVVVAVAILASVLAFGPEPVPTPTPLPTFVPSPSLAPSTAGDGSAAPSAGPSSAASEDPGGAFRVGEPAPPLVVPQVGGGTIDLAELRGEPVWVNFWGTYCPPCVDEFPLMNGFAVRYADEGLVVLAIDVREEEGVVAAFADRLGTTFPLGLDADGSVAADWDAVALPVHFWIDREGIIRDGALGGIGPDIMARGVSTILGITVEP